MQDKNLKLKKVRMAAMPLIDQVGQKLGLRAILAEFVTHERHVDALEILIKNVLLTRSALYRVKDWAQDFDKNLTRGSNFNDDVLARALDRLYKVDRASLQTRVILAAIKRFGIDTSTIHNDSTSVSFDGDYVAQEHKAVQLRRGHSKDHRPDLKQLVYNLSVTADEAIPVHFKTYDGNVTDDTTHQETWLSLRGLLGKSNFLYVADSKLCTEANMSFIDRNQGRFITTVPKTRTETREFIDAICKSTVRWRPLWQKKSRRSAEENDSFEIADGLWQMREGYRLFWYRSSEKMRRDGEEREERINDALAKLTQIAQPHRRGPKTEKALLKAAEAALKKCGAEAWITVEISVTQEDGFRKLSRGRASRDAVYRRVVKRRAQMNWQLNEEAIARSKAADGIFPLTTNTELDALDILKHYKYQPRLEKRFAFLKSVVTVAPVFLKRNSRIEALMFIYFLAMLLAALTERALRQAMAKKGIKTIHTLPEERPSSTPTWEQITRLFEGHARYELLRNERAVQYFHDDLTASQLQVLELLDVPKEAYC